MPQTSICRMCLGTDVRMITIVGTPLQAVYEKITDAELLDNMKPVVACYICLAQLRRCRSFMEKSVKADEVLNGILMNNTLTMKSVARIDRNSYNLCHTLSIKVTSEDQEVDEGKIKKELEFEFAGAEENQVEATFEEHTDFAPLNEPVVHIDEKAFEQPVDAEFLEVTYMKEEKEEIEPPLSDADDNREADSEDDIPLRPVSVKSVKTNKRKRDGDSDWKPAKKVASEKTPATKKEPTTKKEPGKQKKRDEPSVPGQKKFKCHCGASFGRRYHWKRHINTHTGEKPHKCNFCSASFSVPYHLKRHLTVHSNIFPYSCTHCQRRFKRMDHLKSHLTIHGQYAITTEVKIEIEKQPGNNETYLVPVKYENIEVRDGEVFRQKQQKIKIEEGEICSYDVGSNIFADDVGSNIFAEKNVKQQSNSRVIKGKSNRTRTRDSDVSKSYLCNECGANFGRSDHLRRHIKIHSRRLTHECIVCPWTFNTTSELKGHLRRVHNFEEKYECDICQRKFTVKINLERHISKHFENDNVDVNSSLENEPSICSVCGVILNRKSNLKMHMLIHTGEKPYKCNKCPKSFSQSGSLSTHLKMHTGIKPYECVICNHKFLSKGNLNKHITKHSAEKPHECNFCSRKFKRKDVMKMHMKIHSSEKPHECHICQRKFALKKTFKKHVSKHESEKRLN